MKRLAKHVVTGNFITPQTVLDLIKSNYREYYEQIKAGELTFASTKDQGSQIGNAFQGFFIVNKNSKRQWLVELYQFNSKKKEPILFVVDATAKIPDEAAAEPAWNLNGITCIPDTTARRYFNESKNRLENDFCATEDARVDRIIQILKELKEIDPDKKESIDESTQMMDNLMSKSAKKRLVKRW